MLSVSALADIASQNLPIGDCRYCQVPDLLGAAFTSNSTFPLVGISVGHVSGGRGPGRFFPATTRPFQAIVPDLAVCTSPMSFAQSEGSAKSRA